MTKKVKSIAELLAIPAEEIEEEDYVVELDDEQVESIRKHVATCTDPECDWRLFLKEPS